MIATVHHVEQVIIGHGCQPDTVLCLQATTIAT